MKCSEAGARARPLPSPLRGGVGGGGASLEAPALTPPPQPLPARGRGFGIAAALSLFFATPAFAIDPAPVVAAERAFAADGLALGVRDSFLKHSAPDGIVIAPEPILAKAAFAAPQPKGPPLTWWPLWAGIARSGDLGFTTGPYAVDGARRGFYFTVWAKQPDGAWKWLYDGGPGVDASAAGADGSPVAYARLSDKGVGSPAKAMTQVTAAERVLHAAAKTDVKAAYLAAISDDGRIVGSRAKPPANRAELETELGTRATSIAFGPMGGQASDAGDMAWTYGAAKWAKDGKDQRGHYVRVWRHDKAGWKLLYDQILPAPDLKTPPVSPPA